MQNQLCHEILDLLPGYIGWKDTNSRYLGCNNHLANILQLKNKDQITGLLESDLPGCTEKDFKVKNKNDQLALSGKTIRGIHKSSSPYNGSFFYFVKKPITDDNNKIVGLIYHCNEFSNSSFINELYQLDHARYSQDLHSSYYEINKEDLTLKLSERELECLFFMLRGMTAKQIGERIQLSKRTIESYIENIKNKFGCNTKSELLVQAIHLGYMHIIPPRFLSLPYF